MAIDLDFADNKFVHLYYTYAEEQAHLNKVSSFVYDGKLKDETILADAIPGARLHDGSRIDFGQDGRGLPRLGHDKMMRIRV